eukprot:966050-Alexandrium_andersonii.AAC.1
MAVTRLVQARAFQGRDPPMCLEVPEGLSETADLLEALIGLAEDDPPHVERTEQSAHSSKWHLTVAGAQIVELVETRINPSPVFHFDPSIPLDNATLYQLISALEHQGF